MTSCGGMVSVIVRRSTLTIRSTIGIRMKRPGPFGSGKSRPRRKTIPRSYSRATLIAEIRNRTTRKTTTPSATSPAAMRGSLRHRGGFAQPPHGELEAVDRLDAHAAARNELAALGVVGAPELAEHEDLARRAHDALGADDAYRPDGDGPAADRDRLREREGPEEPERPGDDQHEREGRVVRRRRVVEQ